MVLYMVIFSPWGHCLWSKSDQKGKDMQHRRFPKPLLSAILSFLLFLPVIAQADDGNYYNFDYEDFWREYKEWGYPAGTRLPCNGSSEATCSWAWKPWYEHNTQIPQMDPETWNGRTVSGYALTFYYYGSDKNLHGGVFRRESVAQCHDYRFTMWARSGLDAQHPASTNARMQVGISPTGDYPDQVVLTPDRIDAITWSAQSNSQYAYEQLSVEAEAQADVVTVFTRADPDPNNQPYIFWDEGSFSEIARTENLIDASQPLPVASSYIQGIGVSNVSGSSATISWNTGTSSTLGQVLYRRAGVVTGEITTTLPMSFTTFLPLVTQSPDTWQYSTLDSAWQTTHQIILTGLEGNSIYEYIVVSYGYIAGACTPIVSESTEPRRFETP